jgi:DNA-binding XRE family transcriptional regulator
LKSAKPNRNVGRPTAYKNEYSEQAYKLCLLGATDVQLADFFGVSKQTVNAWKMAHPEFLDSLKRGKDVADTMVAESLYQRAIGYSHPDVHISNYQGEITITDITKHYPPDTVAAIFWLKNRQPRKWKDKIEVKEDLGINVFPPKEVLDAIYNKALAEAAKRDAFLVGRRERLGIVIDAEARDVE